MRTTVTLDPDVEALVRKLMRSRKLTFKEAINSAIRGGLAPTKSARFSTRTFSMGYRPEIPLDHALRLAGELEDAELMRKMAARK